jgi:hypothetical protein
MFWKDWRKKFMEFIEIYGGVFCASRVIATFYY